MCLQERVQFMQGVVRVWVKGAVCVYDSRRDRLAWSGKDLGACLISQLSTVLLKTKLGWGPCYSKPLYVPTHEEVVLVSQPKQQFSI